MAEAQYGSGKGKKVRKPVTNVERASEHLHWNFDPMLPLRPGEHGLPIDFMDHPHDISIEDICGGIDESQHVEQYDGSLGVTAAFVAAHQSPVGQLQWNNNLEVKYKKPGDCSNLRWTSGTLIGRDLFLTAGHSFDQEDRVPRVDDTFNPIPQTEIATNMHVNFNFQVDPAGVPRMEQHFAVVELLEYRLGEHDFAIVRLAGNPGDTFGFARISDTDVADGSILCIIGHPAGLPKRIDAGHQFHSHFDKIGYNDIDTLGSNSGSGILHSPSGRIVGVHTHGGCDNPMIGHNHGVRISAIIAASPIVSKIVTPNPLPTPGNFPFDHCALVRRVIRADRRTLMQLYRRRQNATSQAEQDELDLQIEEVGRELDVLYDEFQFRGCHGLP